jgi:bacterioferritin-associated ferredoxin
MYICLCHSVTEADIEESVLNGKVNTFQDLQEQLKVATCCGTCMEFAQDHLEICQQYFLELNKEAA